MFTDVLQEDEKKDFLELIYKMANVDDDYAEEEQFVVKKYMNELDLDEIPDTKDVDEIIKSFGEKSEETRKTVFFELFSMILADDVIEDSEEEFLEKIRQAFKLDAEVVEKIEAAAKNYQAAIETVYEAVF